MGKPNFTAAQRQAIDYRGGDLLLSAAAGSGKTATLTERIVSLLTAPDSDVEISRILCVTFTRAAAAELKERIGKALREAIAARGASSRLTRQLCDLGRAQITTIHAFCLHTLRPHFAELGLPAGFSVAEEAEVRTIARRVMSDVISEAFDTAEEEFLTLADTLAGARDEASLDAVLLALADTLEGQGIDGDGLCRLAEDLSEMHAFFATPAGAGTRTRVRRFAAHYRAYFADAAAEFAADDLFAAKYLPAAEAAYALADALYAAADAGDWDGCRAAILSYAPPSLGVIRAEKQTPSGTHFKEMRAAFKKEIDRLAARTFSLSEAEVEKIVLRTARVAHAAGKILQKYFTALAERKRERGVVDFSDLETMTVRLLTDGEGNPTPAARDIAAQYDYIFIDEYQDTNALQDSIFAAIGERSRRFMVGDIKQSIYRFRGAEPEVFSSYRRRFPPLSEAGETPPCASLFMRENFRCDETVVDFVNLVSRHIFSRGTIPFSKEDELAFAKPTAAGYTPAPVEVCLFPKKDADEDGVIHMDEASYVARRIGELLAHGRRADGKPLTPSDIAILLRSSGADGAAFAEALAARGIPSSYSTRGEFFAVPEVVYACSILRAADNPVRDIDLAAAMRGPVFGFSLDDLIAIRRACPAGSLWDAVRVAAGLLPPDESEGAEIPVASLSARCGDFAARLADLRADARGMRADEFLLKMYKETDLAEIAASDADCDGRAVGANLRMLYDMARRFEGGAGGGLYSFLRYIDASVEAGEGAPAEETDAVRIMSIHHAKGLEFPVCFVCRTDKRRNTKDTDAALLFDPSLGAVMRLPDDGGLVRCETPLRRSVADALGDAAVEEEMRVLYVALTRARERLIVTAAVPDPESHAENIKNSADAPYFSEYSVLAAPNYITWITDALAAAYMQGEDTSFVTVTAVAEAAETEIDATATAEGSAMTALLPGEADAVAAEISARLAYVYPLKYLSAVPAKLTVSRLYPAILDEEDDALSVPAFTERERNAPPAFLAGETGTEASFAGTATHVFLQFADFSRLAEQGVAAECERLLAEGFFTAEMAAAVRTDELARFVESDLFARMRDASLVKREFRFNAALPAADFTKDASLSAKLARADVKITVQGVIDTLFIDRDGRAVLVDYKTDRLTAAEMANPALAAEKLLPRHGDQLRYYRAVASGMFARPIDECLIYSLPLGGTVSVP